MGTYGIDLGTTYSCIAKLNEFGEPKILKNYIDGTDMFASAVFSRRMETFLSVKWRKSILKLLLKDL